MDEGTRKVTPATRRKLNPTTIALVVAGLIIAGLSILLLAGGGGDQDRLSDEEVAGNSVMGDPEEQCADQDVYDRIKSDLFRRAAAVRGADQSAYNSLAGYSVLRGETPILREHDEELNRVTCSAYFTLDLPPGVAVAGGRRSLNAEIGYAIQPSADGSGKAVTLTSADALITPLATLMRTGAQAGTPIGNSTTAEEPLVEQPADPNVPSEPPSPQPAPQQPASPEEPTASANPSFNCNLARTRGEIAVCNSSGLAALDRQMAAQFRGALSGASSSERSQLIRTRDRFLRYRDGCRSDDCIADAYRGRMREIRDIMAGRWQP